MGEYRAQPEAMRAGVGNVGGIIMRSVNAVADLESLVVAPASFAEVGSAVATANAALQAGQVAALRSLLSLLQQVNDQVKCNADAVGRPSTLSIWGTPSAAELATHAFNDSVSAGGEPGSVDNVLRYMRETGLGDIGRFEDVADFNNWLAGNADNQARAGIVEVYSGTARDLGGVRNGDVVIVEPFGDDPIIGVAGEDGQLYNHGRIDAGIHAIAKVSVYRPAPTS